MSHITIYLKNLAGEVLPLEVPSETTVAQLVNRLSSLDEEKYPSERTHLLREEEEKEGTPLMEGEVVSVFVSEGVQTETGRFPLGGKHYHRLLIPFAGQTLYLYLTSYHNRYMERHVLRAEYGVSFSPEITKPSETFQSASPILYTAIHQLVPDVTPAQMASLYSIVLSEWEKLEEKQGVTYQHVYFPGEPMQCECGSIVQRRGLRTHERSQKHRTWLVSL